MSPVGDRPGLAGMRLLVEALRDLRGGWARCLDLVLLSRALAFAVLTPLAALLLRWLLWSGGHAAVADVEIARFLLTTVPGVVALVLVSALLVAISLLEQAGLMTLGLAGLRGRRLRVRDAFAHGVARSFAILRLSAHLVVRVLLVALPFAAALGLVSWTLLRRHDVNYYLAARPPALWVAAALAALVVLLLAVVLGRQVAGWVLALPIVVFEKGLPALALGESARRMEGRRLVAAQALAGWGAASVGLGALAAQALLALGRWIGPAFSGSLAGMLLFIGSAAVTWLLVSLAVGALTAALAAQLAVRLYLEAGPADRAELPPPFHGELAVEGHRLQVSWPVLAGGVAVGALAAALLANTLMKATWTDRPVLVFGHRGSPLEAPENTLASFRRAGEARADYVELDVQESSDGVVLVGHDADLMKLARSPLRFWESTAAQLRAVDIGSSFSPAFADQRVPTLAEALAACRGVSRVDIELKDYGHDQQLEERVVALVEAAGMQDQVVTMSLSRGMVERMKRLRPGWTSGLLLTKEIGSPGGLAGDFLAIQSGMATRRFIRAAHAAGKQVYVWTVDEPQRMVRLIGLGADGLISNRPAVAREVVASYRAMDPARRLFLFTMASLGAEEELALPEGELRP